MLSFENNIISRGTLSSARTDANSREAPKKLTPTEDPNDEPRKNDDNNDDNCSLRLGRDHRVRAVLRRYRYLSSWRLAGVPQVDSRGMVSSKMLAASRSKALCVDDVR